MGALSSTIMPLEFRGDPVFELESNTVRFVGFPTAKAQQTQVIVCRATCEAISMLAVAPNPTPRDLLRTFNQHRDVFHVLASAEFDLGACRPLVDAESIGFGGIWAGAL